MKYHPNARLTIHQRRALREDFLAGASRAELAAKYHVSPKTVQRWCHRESPQDRSSAPQHRRSKRPPGYKAAVRHLRQAHRAWGTRRLATELRPWYRQATRSTVRHIVRVARLQARATRRRRECHPIPVGWHRLQMDCQQLPALGGGTGYEYKISVIHLRTRWKYSEIHPNHQTRTVAGVLQRALDRLPPAWLVWTDKALEFTMTYSANRHARNAFQKTVAALGLQHGTCQSRCPWQNGIIERSHRTDNEECFRARYFAASEERKYYHRLWEMDYNTKRAHQGLGGATPLDIFRRDYRLHAAAAMLLEPTYWREH